MHADLHLSNKVLLLLMAAPQKSPKHKAMSQLCVEGVIYRYPCRSSAPGCGGSVWVHLPRQCAGPDTVTFSAMLLVLLTKPEGLFYGSDSRRRLVQLMKQKGATPWALMKRLS